MSAGLAIVLRYVYSEQCFVRVYYVYSHILETGLELTQRFETWRNWVKCISGILTLNNVYLVPIYA